MDGLLMVYGWFIFMDGLWVVYGWFIFEYKTFCMRKLVQEILEK